MQQAKYQQISIQEKQFELDISTTTKSTKSNCSEFIQSYQKLVETTTHFSMTAQIKQRLLSAGVSFVQQQESYPNGKEQYEFFIEMTLNQSQIVIYNVRIQEFQFKIYLFNFEGKNPLLRYKEVSGGSYGKVYFINIEQYQLALKVLPYSQYSHSSFTIFNAIKEYSIMKLCSLLECGPQLTNFFGFQLIAYDDSIMFCMERVNKIQGMDALLSQKLKKKLQLMHHNRIIHFDIKPENLMMSPALKQPIFIDFGLSQIIEEFQGEKTLMKFKGSPAYCSEQMIDLLMNPQKSEYIDAYYNDAISLNSSIKLIHMYALQQDQCTVLNQKIIQEEKVDIQLLVVLLKYNLIHKQIPKIAQTIKYKDNFLLKNMRQKILTIFQENISIGTFQQIFSELRELFHKFIDLQEIENYFKTHSVTFKDNQIKPKQGIKFRQRLQEQKRNQRKPFNYKNYVQFLKINDAYINPKYQEISKHMLIECLRFDRQNFNLQQKVAISETFLKAYDKFHQNRTLLSYIQSTFRQLLDNSLAFPRTQWKKQHIFIILRQALIMEIDLNPYLQQIELSLIDFFHNVPLQIECYIQTTKLINICFFKHSFLHQNNVQRVLVHLNNFSKKLILSTFERQKSLDPKAVNIVMAFRLLSSHMPLKQKLFYIMRCLSTLGDYNLRNKLIEFMFFQLLSISQNECLFDVTQYMLDQIKQITLNLLFERDEGFITIAYYVYKVLAINKNQRELRFVLQKMIKTINCQQISDRFKFSMCIFLHSESMDPKLMRKYALQIIEAPFSVFKRCLMPELTLLLRKIRSSHSFYRQNADIMIKIYYLYMNIEEKQAFSNKILSFQQVDKILINYNTFQFFAEFVEEFSRIRLPNIIKDYKQKFSQSQQQNGKQYKFQQLIYLSIIAHKAKQYNRQVQLFEQLYQIARDLRNQKLEQYLLRKIIMGLLMVNEKQKLKSYTYIFYSLTDEIPSFARYFQFKSKPFIAITLNQFLLYKDLTNFYKFLLNLAKFVTKFPYAQNFLHLHDNIKRLMLDENNLKCMKYSLLKQIIGENYWDCHYYILYYCYSLQIQQEKIIKLSIFGKMAKSIGSLSNYAKEKIMEIWLRQILHLFNSNKRKHIFMLFKWGYKYLRKKTFVAFAKDIIYNLLPNQSFTLFLQAKMDNGIEK